VLTIFSCPKLFRGHINIIQRNAIRSWTLLQPRPEIILIGDDEGTGELCKELGIRHIPEVQRNEYGTPLVSSVFEIAQQQSVNDVLCYVNADIILLSNFITSVTRSTRSTRSVDLLDNRPFLLIGRRWDIDIDKSLSFEPGWEEQLKMAALKKGRIQVPEAMDYFVFTRGLYDNVPPFGLGRACWDNWLVYYAVTRKATLIDLTTQNMIFHQNHNYSHIPDLVDSGRRDYPERKVNERLIGKWWPLRTYGVWDANFVLVPEGLSKLPPSRKMYSQMRRVADCVAIVLDKFMPFSWPLYVVGKRVKSLLSRLCRAAIDRIA